ncbi:hypothetical protein EG68_07969 [Paragonimus skrjabini miyazakii]|uniref:Lysosome-associated membrane glycoprotein 5 n=1 Tax=Paragonimus skrjabini miyazakii TaxID=59628 RepID=A0A8S9YKN5_9TREM|nr:hypothetical protein EG68_07969 [Paragonimus skrjabini miyazakii]
MQIFRGIILCIIFLTRQANLSNGAGIEGDPMFHILDDNNTYCLLADFNLTIDITYTLKAENKKATRSFSPTELLMKPEAKCGKNQTLLSLQWNQKGASHNWSTVFNLTKSVASSSGKEDYFSLSSITVKYFTEEALFPDSAGQDWKEVSTNQVVFKTVVGRHFQCENEQSIGMYLSDSSKKDTDASLKMTNTKIEAFMKSEKPEFSEQKTICSADENPDNTVPIAVGITLAICIVVALVVFVIFNRRNRRLYGTV